MKTLKVLSLLAFLTIAGLSINQRANAQDEVPTEVASSTNMNLEEGQEKLASLGYEVCSTLLRLDTKVVRNQLLAMQGERPTPMKKQYH